MKIPAVVRPLALGFAFIPAVRAAEFAPLPADAVASKVPLVAQPFDLADVTLGPGLFRDAMDRDRAYLMELEPDRFLHTFRLNVGLPSTAQPYGGWEAPGVELRGHSAGHYLSACSLMYRSTGDAALKERVDAMVRGLAACQAASVKAGFHAGYLSAFPESFIDRNDAGQPVWAPWYSLHKIMAGLLDAHRLTGNTQAREVLLKLTDWVAYRVDRLPSGQMQASLKNEFGGMNDVLAGVYALTGDPKHLQAAQAFDHAAVFDPLAAGRDELDGLHANTQIPKIIGAVREYELTGEVRYGRIARFFSERVARHRSYAIGGHSDGEHFFPVNDFAGHLTNETAETCNTYNMLKLTRDLFALEPDARSMDFYERGLYNHILASQDPARGMCTYLMSLQPGHFKTYATPEHSFWCCVGTGMENHAKYGDTIFSHSADALYVNLFIPAAVRWRDQGVTITQATDFPRANTTMLTIAGDRPAAFTLRVRHPAWADGPLVITVNGVAFTGDTGAPGSYASVGRTWQPGDRVTITLPMALRAEPLPGTTGEVAIFYGPIVLAGKLGTDGMPVPYAGFQLEQARFPDPTVPALVTDRTGWLASVEKVSDAPLVFRTRGLGRPHDVTLEPFYGIHHERTTVYWSLLKPAEWDARQQAIAQVATAIDAARKRATDRVVAGDLTSESAHDYHGAGTFSGDVSGHTWREAQQTGSFSYRLVTGGHDDLALLCVIGTRDRNRKFDVYIDDTKLDTPALDGQGPGMQRTISLPVPAGLSRGKKALTIHFQTRGNWDAATANIFECLLVPAGEG